MKAKNATKPFCGATDKVLTNLGCDDGQEYLSNEKEIIENPFLETEASLTSKSWSIPCDIFISFKVAILCDVTLYLTKFFLYNQNFLRSPSDLGYCANPFKNKYLIIHKYSLFDFES